MNDVVSNTLKKWRQSEFGYDNQNNCILSLVTYLVDCGYPDFSSEFKNSFENEETALNYVDECGGEEYLINGTGLSETKTPQRGDIVLAHIGKNVVGLYLGDKIAFRTSRGVIEINKKLLNVVKTWKVEICPL